MRTNHLALPAAFCLACSSPAADFFVSPTGNDLSGNGSAASPWRTLSHAANSTPGNTPNTIRLAPGIYREATPGGLKPNVSIAGAGPALTVVENAFVNAAAPGFDFLLRLDTALDGLPDGTLIDGNQSISGFHIVGVDHANHTRQNGIRIRGRHRVTIENMRFSNMGNGGLEIRAMDGVNQSTGPSGYLEGIVVRNCEFENTAKDRYANLLIGGLDGADLSDLVITEARGIGIKAWVGGWLKNLRIRRCLINMLPPGRDRNATTIDDWPSIELTQVSTGSEISDNFLNHWISISTSLAGGGEWNLRIRNNHFVYENGTIQPIQIGNHGTPNVEVSGNYFENIGPSYAVANWPFFGAISNVSVHHNVFKGNGVDSRAVLFQPNDPAPGFSGFNGNIAGIRVFNNTFVDVSDAILLQPLKGHSAQDVAIQNNVFADFSSLAEPRALVSFNTVGGSIFAASVSHNLFHNIPEDRGVAGTVATNSRFEDPAMVRSGPLPRPYYELAPLSAAVNAGIAVAGFPVADGLTDLGAYEFVAATTNTDSDGDGQTDAAEAIAGTSPLDSNDVLRIVQTQTGGGQVSLTWTSVPGKSYAIESTTTGFNTWSEQTRSQATGALTTATVPPPAGSSVYFRVRVF